LNPECKRSGIFVYRLYIKLGFYQAQNFLDSKSTNWAIGNLNELPIWKINIRVNLFCRHLFRVV
jgi:hypothetical protein